MYRVIRRFVMMVVVGGSCSVAIAGASAAPDGSSGCEEMLRALPAHQGLSVSGCSAVDPRTIDIRQTDREMESCGLPDGRIVKKKFVGGDLLNPLVQVFAGEETILEYVLEPTTKIRSDTFGSGPQLSCDDHGRYYVAHPIKGYVAAFNHRSELLWRRSVPGFVPLEESVPEGKAQLSVVANALNSSASLISQVRVSGEYVAVEFRTGGVGTRQIVYHRSGVPVGELGPWDGRILESTPSGWRLVAGGGWDLRFYIPKQQLELAVTDHHVQDVIRHALAWLQPRPMDKELKFQCLSRLADELQHWLGEEFNDEYAEIGKQALVALGGEEWFSKLVASPDLHQVVERFDPISTGWQDDYVRALVAAGADVDIAQQLTHSDEHPVKEPPGKPGL